MSGSASREYFGVLFKERNLEHAELVLHLRVDSLLFTSCQLMIYCHVVIAQ